MQMHTVRCAWEVTSWLLVSPRRNEGPVEPDFKILKANRMKNETKIACISEIAAATGGGILFHFIKSMTSFLRGAQQISIKLLERLANAARVLQAFRLGLLWLFQAAHSETPLFSR